VPGRDPLRQTSKKKNSRYDPAFHSVTESWYDPDFNFVVDDTWAFTNYGVFETTQGEVFFRERTIVDFEAPDGRAVHINVLGGTGRYEGATGWMAYFDNFAGEFTTWGGEICWPED